MNNKFYFLLAIQIIAFFIVAMAINFLSNYLITIPEFGDFKCTGISSTCDSQINGDHYIGKVHWGFRHILYAIMCGILFIVGIVRLINWTDWYLNKNKQ